ncbi:MAG TPA: hypothetical protein VK563_16555 [Puia sp.]|nr:hypothetical protein [Puia sp.]
MRPGPYWASVLASPALSGHHKKSPSSEGPFFYVGFFTVKFFSSIFLCRKVKKRASDRHRRPVLTSETTKRKTSDILKMMSDTFSLIADSIILLFDEIHANAYA